MHAMQHRRKRANTGNRIPIATVLPPVLSSKKNSPAVSKFPVSMLVPGLVIIAPVVVMLMAVVLVMVVAFVVFMLVV